MKRKVELPDPTATTPKIMDKDYPSCRHISNPPTNDTCSSFLHSIPVHVVVSLNRGAQSRPQNILFLIYGDPQKGIANFGKLLCK